MIPSRLKHLAALVALFVVYVVTAKLGLRLDAVGGFATLVWPPTGIALAALLLHGSNLWPAIALGAFVVNFTSGAPVLVSCGIACGNTLEALMGAYLLREVWPLDPSLRRIRDVLWLVLGAGVLSTLVSATIGTVSLLAGGVIDSGAFTRVLRAWWVGDALGDLIVAPILLVWGSDPPRLRGGRWLEATAVGGAVVLVSLYIFGGIGPASAAQFRWPYLIFPVLVWGAWRFRQHGASGAILLLWFVATVETISGLGPFAAIRLSEGLLSMQVFMSVISLTMLFLGAVITERDAAQEHTRFVAEASRVLASGLDYEQVVRQIARLVVPALADNCVVDLLAPDGSMHRAAEASADPAKEELLRQLRKYPPDPTRPASPVLKVLKTGKTEFIPRFDNAALQAVAANDEYAAIVRALAPRSSVSVPLKGRNGILGAITFGMAESGRTYRPEDIHLAEELAGRAALAVENASLYEQAQQAIRARDVFLAVASHELRTPLTALTLQLLNLRRSFERETPADAANAVLKVNDLSRQVERMAGLVERLLDVSRAVSGRIELVLEDVELRDLVGDVVSRFQDQATSSGSRLTLNAESDSCVGRWDRMRIEQILANLLANAIKFGAGEPIELVLSCAETHATLTVRDGGIGIAPQDHERIFGRFQQTDAHQPFGGLGLGLWISRQVVSAMGGTIEVKSELGAGAEFVVRLPRTPKS